MVAIDVLGFGARAPSEVRWILRDWMDELWIRFVLAVDSRVPNSYLSRDSNLG